MSPTEGYPDFVRTTEWADETWLIAAEIVGTTTGAAQYGPFMVGHWHSIDFYFEATFRDHQIQLRWSNDSGMVSGTTSEFYAVRDGCRMHIVVPNRARWVDITFSVSGANPTHRLYATLTNRQLSRTNTRADIPLVDYDNVLIGIGATNTKYLNWTHPGRAFFSITCGVAGALAFFSESIGGASRKIIFAKAYVAGDRDNQRIYLSNGICGAFITNTAGVGGSFFMELIPFIE